MVRNAKNGYKGKFFIQFSFSLPGSWSELGFLPITRLLCSCR